MELYVGNLPWSVTDESLTSLFAAHGQVDRAKVVMDRDTGRSRGFAFVTINDENVANAAIAALNGKDMDGRALTVRKAEPKPPRQDGGVARGTRLLAPPAADDSPCAALALGQPPRAAAYRYLASSQPHAVGVGADAAARLVIDHDGRRHRRAAAG